jgi:hypothetical protein
LGLFVIRVRILVLPVVVVLLGLFVIRVRILVLPVVVILLGLFVIRIRILVVIAAIIIVLLGLFVIRVRILVLPVVVVLLGLFVIRVRILVLTVVIVSSFTIIGVRFGVAFFGVTSRVVVVVILIFRRVRLFGKIRVLGVLFHAAVPTKLDEKIE